MRYWLYNEDGGKLFDTSPQERARLEASGEWFDTPAKVGKKEIVDPVAVQEPVDLLDMFDEDSESMSREQLLALARELDIQVHWNLKESKIRARINEALNGDD